MKQALVTGGTSGIGRAIALALKAEGYGVTVIGRQQAALDELRESHAIHGLRLDLADRPALERALSGLAPDVLVNNAGMMPPLSNFCDQSPQDISRTVALNLNAVLDVTRAVAPAMRARQSGHIFFTGSTAGHAPFVNFAVYCATKAAVGGFAQALRMELAPHGVRVTEIVAGRVETGLYQGILSEAARAAMYANRSAVQPKDVAEMLLATLRLPPHVDVSRFDILPTHQATATGSAEKKDK